MKCPQGQSNNVIFIRYSVADVISWLALFFSKLFFLTPRQLFGFFRNRSELIREALRSHISNQEKWDELFKYGKAIAITSALPYP